MNSAAISKSRSQMLAEAHQAPSVVAQQLLESVASYRDFGEQLRAKPPASVLTVARGSSDHAAHFMAYLIMARLGKLVTSLPMSLITLYQSKIDCQGLLSMAFSQSGQSPDLVAPMQYFTAGGATTAAFINDPHSPLAAAAQWVFPLCAGAERSVAWLARALLRPGKMTRCYKPHYRGSRNRWSAPHMPIGLPVWRC